jgi:hypothetical protein
MGRVVPAIPKGANPAGYSPFLERHYAWEDFTWREPSSWIPPALFLWPLPLLGFAIRASRRWVRRLSFTLEPVLAATSSYFIWELSGVGERSVGACLAIGANILYTCAWCWQVAALWARKAKV